MNNSSHMSVANPHHVSNGHHTTGGISPNSLMNTSLGKEIRFHYKESGLLLSIHFIMKTINYESIISISFAIFIDSASASSTTSSRCHTANSSSHQSGTPSTSGNILPLVNCFNKFYFYKIIPITIDLQTFLYHLT